MMIDTFHLFDETYAFLKEVERLFGFSAHIYKPKGCETRADFDEKYGDDLFISDIEMYDRLAKVEPLLRGLVLDRSCFCLCLCICICFYLYLAGDFVHENFSSFSGLAESETIRSLTSSSLTPDP